MSSLDQERLLEKGTAPAAAAEPAASTESSSRRRTSRITEQAAEGDRARTTTPRTGSATARTGATTRARAAAKAAGTAAGTIGRASARAKAATQSPVAKAATAKAATARAAVTKAAVAKVVPAKAAVAKTAGAKATTARAAVTKAVATRTAAKPAATKAATTKPAATKPAATKPATTKPAATKPAATKLAATKPAATKPAGPKHAAPKRGASTKPAAIESGSTAAAPEARPVPHPRTPVAAELCTSAPTTVPVVALTGRRPKHRALTSRRRPAMFLAAAVVSALGVGLLGAHTSAAEARGTAPAEHTVSVSSALGLAAKDSSISSHAATRELSLLAASRAERQAQQAAAVQAQDAADQAAIEAARPKAVLPVNGASLTTCFCMRWGVMHWGIDLAAPLGTPEYAAMDGVVVKAGPASGFGQAVYIQHANGDVTVYGHMEKILVTTGQVVHAGDTIALLGQEGESTGPHLHFEVHAGGIMGQKIDPIPWLRERGVQI